MSETSFEDIIFKISSNPELLNKISSTVKGGDGDMSKALSSVIGILSDSDAFGKQTGENEDKIKSEGKDEKEKILDTSLGIFKDNNEKTGIEGLLFSFCNTISRNTPLLLALKPYLSKDRCEMIDSIVKISKLASIVSLAK